MNVLINNSNNNNNTRTNQSQKRQKSKNYFSNFGSQENLYLSENQRNLTKFNSQKKIKRKESYTNIKNNINNEILVFNNNNNVALKNFTNLVSKTSKIKKNNNNRNKSHYLSKPQLEIEINNRNNSNNVITYQSKIVNNKRYKKNISEHDLVNNILNTFTNCNFTKGNINLNFSSNKKLSYDKSKNKTKKYNNYDNKKINQNKMKLESDTKLLRSSSGYSQINNLAQTNSFFSGKGYNQLGYISTYGNNPDLTNNFDNIIKISNQKISNNKHKSKNNKGPVIGKIIKNYKNNDLNCIFNMNLIPSTHINNKQDYYKHLYKIEYNSDNRYKKINNNKKGSLIIEDKDKEKEKEDRIKTNNDDYTHSKNTMTKTNDISRIKKEKESIDYNDSPEEIHFYVISSIQNSKTMENNLMKK